MSPAPPHFPLPLAGEFLNSGRTFMLLHDFAFVDDPIKIVVPAGFVTDFNSVPRGLWNIFPPWEYPEAGVVHDFLYRFPPEDLTRFQADFIHRRILQIKGCPFWKRWAAWVALRFGGVGPWRQSPLDK